MEGFSYELDPELDAELAAARRRHADDLGAITSRSFGATAPASGNRLIGAGLAPEVVATWLGQVLPGIAERWKRYSGVSSFDNLEGAEDLESYFESQILHSSGMQNAVESLYEAQLTLKNSDERTTSTSRIGDTMELVAIPWRFFQMAGSSLPEELAKLRAVDGKLPDRFDTHVLEVLTDDEDTVYWRRISRAAAFKASAARYLSHRITTEGSWGLMLMQTSPTAGVQSLRGKAPQDYTGEVETREIAGWPFNSMGIFEAMALSLQVDVGKFYVNSPAFLVANEFMLLESAQPFGPESPHRQVPTMDIYTEGASDYGVSWGYFRADNNRARPRLAIDARGLS